MEKIVFTLQGTVLETKFGVFRPEEGRDISWRNALLRLQNGLIVKLKSQVDLQEYLNETCQFTMELYSGANYSAGVRIVQVKQL